MNAQHIVLLHHFRRLLEAAHREGIAVAPLKGAHLITSVYPPYEDRGKMGDVDFLVRAEDWDRVEPLMTALGFFGPSRRSRHEAAFHFSLENGKTFLFEAHRYLFDPRRFEIDHDGLWRRAAQSTCEGQPCFRLAPEDNFCHIAFHSMIHRFKNLARTVRDLELVLVNADPSLNERILERATEWRTTRTAWLLLKLISERRPELVTPGILSALEPPRPVRAAAFLLIDSEVRSRLEKLDYRLQAALLWPLFIDRISSLARMVLGWANE
jgi:hypothetical protein